MGADVGFRVGGIVGDAEGTGVGDPGVYVGKNEGVAEGAAVGEAEGIGVGDNKGITAVTFVFTIDADEIPSDADLESAKRTDSTVVVKTGIIVAELPAATAVDTLNMVKVTTRLLEVEDVDAMPTEATLEITDDAADPAAAFTLSRVE